MKAEEAIKKIDQVLKSRKYFVKQLKDSESKILLTYACLGDIRGIINEYKKGRD